MRRIAERPGVTGVTIRYDVPDAVNELRTRIPDGATVISIREFARETDTRYEWERATAAPSLTYRLPANESVGRTVSVSVEAALLALLVAVRLGRSR